MDAGVRFAHLNLWRNPFGELTDSERTRLAVCDVEPLLQWASAGGVDGGRRRVLQFIGPCGHGKSTHLRALQRRVAGLAYIYVPPQPPYPDLPRGVPLIVDEADRLPLRTRWMMCGMPGVVAIGVHRSLTRMLALRGAATKTIEVANHRHAGRLKDMLNRRILASAYRPGWLPLISATDAQYLILRYGDDIRAIEGYLYERFQQLGGDRHGAMRSDNSLTRRPSGIHRR